LGWVAPVPVVIVVAPETSLVGARPQMKTPHLPKEMRRRA
jgi:hypothetical protein